MPIISLPLAKLWGKTPWFWVCFTLCLFCISKRNAAKFLESSLLPGRSFALGAGFSHAVLVVLTAPCALPETPCPLCFQNCPKISPHFETPPSNRLALLFSFPKNTSRGAFRCSDLEHYHLVFLLWKQDLTGIQIPASVLLTPVDEMCPRANSTKHSHACSSAELFHKACKHFRSLCTSISEWSLLPLDSGKQLLKLLENFQFVTGINSDTNLFLWGSFLG